MLKRQFLPALILTTQILQGCKTHEDLRGHDDRQATILHEIKLNHEFLEELAKNERREKMLLNIYDDSTSPIPQTIKDLAESKKKEICSDQAYLKALVTFNRAVRKRSDAILAEYSIYYKWSRIDRIELASTNKP